MPHLVQKIIFICFLSFSYALNAQEKDKNNTNSLKTLLELQEKKELNEAFALFNKNEDKKAYKIAHRLLKTSKTKANLTNTNLLLGFYFNKRSLIDSSLFYTNQALKYSIKIIDDSLKSRLLSLGYNLMGQNYKKKGLFDLSKKWHLKGLQVSQKHKETDLYYTHLHGLAGIYNCLGDKANAIKLYEKCLYFKEDEEICLGSYINLGDIYSDLKNYEKGNYYYNKGKQLGEKRNNQQAQAVIALGLGANYQLQEKTNDAIKMYNEAVSIADKNELHQIALIARGNIGDTYIDLKKYKEAKEIFITALQKAVSFGYLNNEIYFYEELQKIAVLQNDYKEAYLFANKSVKIKDSISQLQKDKEINELEVKYKTWQKEKEISLLQIENKTKVLELKNKEEALAYATLQKEINQKRDENKILYLNNISQKKANEIVSLKKEQLLKMAEINWQKATKKITLYSFFGVLIPIMGLLFLYYQRLKTQRLLNQNEKEISEQKIISLVKDQELKLIKAAVKGQDKARVKIAKELHDSIGGNLAAIKLQLNTVASKPDTVENIQKQLDETYQQVRDLSHNLIPEKFSQNNFTNLLEEYLKNLAEIDHLKTTFTAYPKPEIDLITDKLQMEIYKIIQELVTNTLKHAKATTIDLQLNYIKDNLNILFEDNGMGFYSQKKEGGIGYKNINSRLNSISGSMEIDSVLKRGTIVNIDIPLQNSHSNTN